MGGTTDVQFGRPSLIFPMAMDAPTAQHFVTRATQAEAVLGTASNYTCRKTFESGATSLRVLLPGAEHPAGVYVGTIAGTRGELPCFMCLKQPPEVVQTGAEIVVFGRPKRDFSALTLLPEANLLELFPVGKSVSVKIVELMQEIQADCPPQWLRDLLLNVADSAGSRAGKSMNLRESDRESPSADHCEFVRNLLGLAGVSCSGKEVLVYPPAHQGESSMSHDELGYWHEEAKMNERCAASNYDQLPRRDRVTA
mmetsp:Transcript_35918/g.86467  ORF Transcript_35918/g.86467 Transcript_35918/m.86467 type:complete len:254 (-) Transcript_35918:69-830(-)